MLRVSALRSLIPPAAHRQGKTSREVLLISGDGGSCVGRGLHGRVSRSRHFPAASQVCKRPQEEAGQIGSCPTVVEWGEEVASERAPQVHMGLTALSPPCSQVTSPPARPVAAGRSLGSKEGGRETAESSTQVPTQGGQRAREGIPRSSCVSAFCPSPAERLLVSL